MDTSDVFLILLSIRQDHALRLLRARKHLLHPVLLLLLLLLGSCLLLLLLSTLQCLHLGLLIPFLFNLLLLVRLPLSFITETLLLLVDDFVVLLGLLDLSVLVLTLGTCSNELGGLGVSEGLLLKREVLVEVLALELPLDKLLLLFRDLCTILIMPHDDVDALRSRGLPSFV